MSKVRLLSILFAAVVVVISKPAGVGSDSSGTEDAAPQEALAAVAPAAGVTFATEADEAAVSSGDSWLCGRDAGPALSTGIGDLEAVIGKLAVSPDPEHLLTAAILRLDSDPGRGLELLARARDANPAHPLIAINLLEACSEHPDLQACAARAVEEEAIHIDGSNGALWARIAGRRYAAGDEPGALQAMARAATAPRYDGYWIDHVMLFERALAASTAASYAERTVAGFGIAAAMASQDRHVFRACAVNKRPSSEWSLACSEYGKRLEADGDTTLDVSLGVALQVHVYERTGDKEQHAVASRRQKELRAKLHSPFREHSRILMFDERVLSGYIAEFDAYGEWAAMQFLDREIARLKAQPDYDPCAAR